MHTLILRLCVVQYHSASWPHSSSSSDQLPRCVAVHPFVHYASLSLLRDCLSVCILAKTRQLSGITIACPSVHPSARYIHTCYNSEKSQWILHTVQNFVQHSHHSVHSGLVVHVSNCQWWTLLVSHLCRVDVTCVDLADCKIQQVSLSIWSTICNICRFWIFLAEKRWFWHAHTQWFLRGDN